MTTHVAEASERSGRVVLWLDPEARCTPELLDAPFRFADAYGAEIETVAIVANGDTLSYDVPIRQIDYAGPAASLANPRDRFALLTERHRRAVDQTGAALSVKVQHAVADGDAVDRISEMCVRRGPWNIVALERLPPVGGHELITALLANVAGATGFLICGTRRVEAPPRVVLLVEDCERLPSMLRVAERLATGEGKIQIVIAAETAADHADLDLQLRLATADARAVEFVPGSPTYGVPGALIHAVARLKPTLVIARFGGSALADARELSRASAATRAPILIVR